MRKLKLVEHISLDGVIQVSGGPGEEDFPYGDWTAPYRTPAGLAMLSLRNMASASICCLAAEPTIRGRDSGRRRRRVRWRTGLNAATKYVVTHRPESLEWGPFEGIGPDFVEGVRGLKAKDGPDLILSGSSTLTSTVLEHGLAEEMLLLVYPVLLGKGKRIFAEGTPPRAFALESTQTSPTGILVNHYKAAGGLQNLR